MRFMGSTPLDSERRIKDKIVPKMGVEKENTDTLDTGLYFKSVPQRA